MKNRMSIDHIIVMAVVWLLTSMIGCQDEVSKINLSAVSSMIKVPMQSDSIVSLNDTAKVSAAGGEYESFQVVISTSDTVALKGVSWSMGALVGKEGKIGNENTEINPVGYVETTVVSRNYTSSLGWWPDPLLQLDTLSVPAGERQPLWVTISVPRETPSGIYNGKIEVKSTNGGSSEIPVSLRVWGFDIPVRSNIKTLTWVKTLKESGGDSRENRKAYYDLLLKHRLGPGGNIELDEDMLGFCMERGMNAFILDNIPNLARKNQDNYTESYKDSLRTRLNDYVDRFGPRGWLDGMAYIYNYDEVDRNHWPLAKEMYSFVKGVSEDFNVIQCLNIPEGVEALTGYADTWDVYVSQFEKSGVKKRVEAGDEAWLAICCWPSVHPNVFLEYPAIDGRILGWICYHTGVTGFEYWSPNHWDGNNTSPGLRGGWKANTFRNYNGDGYLTYPNPGGTPLSSVRLENLRDGFEDYEYLFLLKELGDDTDIIQPVVSGPVDYTSNPELLYQVREEVARRIEKKMKKN